MIKKLLAVAGCMLMVSMGLTTQAGADAPIRFQDSVTFTDINPCTGLEHEITINFDVSIHEHQNNFVLHLGRSGTTDDGYSMHGAESQTGTSGGFRAHFVDIWKSSDGSKFRVLGNFVANDNQEEIKVDSFSFKCLGRS